MKTLLLIRHAKSSWGDAGLADRDRPLNERGLRDAPVMGKRLAQRGVVPDLVLSSPARRALSTAELFAVALGVKRDHFVIDERLYAARADDLLRVVQGLDEHLKCVLLFAHNPGLTDLAHHFAREITHLITCAVVAFEFEPRPWSAIGRARPVQVTHDDPRQD